MTESIMSRNFVHYGKGGSEYTDAILAAQRAHSSMITRQMSILTTGRALVNTLPSDATYAEISLEGRKAARLMGEEKNTATYEVSKRNLDEQKEDIEDRAEEAMNAEEEQNVLSTKTVAENGDAEATDNENGDAEAKTAEELKLEQQAAAEAQDDTAETSRAAEAQQHTPLHIVV